MLLSVTKRIALPVVFIELNPHAVERRLIGFDLARESVFFARKRGYLRLCGGNLSIERIKRLLALRRRALALAKLGRRVRLLALQLGYSLFAYS